jgi:serine/threonine protein kinase
LLCKLLIIASTYAVGTARCELYRGQPAFAYCYTYTVNVNKLLQCVGEALEPLFEAIRTETPEFGEAISSELADLLKQLLDKDPATRITLKQCLQHAWLEGVPEPVVVLPDSATAAAADVGTDSTTASSGAAAGDGTTTVS